MNSLLLAALLTQAQVAVRDVDVPSFDGQRLAATYYDPGVAGPAVVIFRNCDQQRASVDAFARKLSARGVHVLAYDYRGGPAAGRSWQETRTEDAVRVHAWLLSQRGVDTARYAALGGSCGVQVALDLAMARPQGLAGVVILSGPSSQANRAFVARTTSLAVLGGASRSEGADGPNGFIQPVVAVSTHNASQMIIVPEGHGTGILEADARFEATVLTWLAARLGLPAVTGR